MGHGSDQEKQSQTAGPTTKSPVDFDADRDRDNGAEARSTKALGRAYMSAAKTPEQKRASFASSVAACRSTGDALSLFAKHLHQATSDLRAGQNALINHTYGDAGPDRPIELIAGIVHAVEGASETMERLLGAADGALRVSLAAQVKQVVGEWNPCWVAMGRAIGTCDAANEKRGLPVTGLDVSLIDRRITSFPSLIGVGPEMISRGDRGKAPEGDMAQVEAASIDSDLETAAAALASAKLGNTGDVAQLTLAVGHLSTMPRSRLTPRHVTRIKSIRADLEALTHDREHPLRDQKPTLNVLDSLVSEQHP